MCQWCAFYNITSCASLLCDAFERLVIVETKVSRVDDVVGFGVACELVQLPQIAFSHVSRALTVWLCIHLVHTSNVCDAQDSRMAELLHATLVGVEWSCSWHGAAGLLCAAVGEICLRVGARLRRWL